ncbi:putative disease resistance protein RGA1 isoform X1 [Typha angustifolia]|uniref:putative disease resistance protein RGA1 isoform X1 n=1 Tax=Typha angustifolia TaxID=59011 RepID=UPI003C2F95F5
MAGELVASAVVRELLKKLGSGLWSELGLLWNFKKDLDDMKTTLLSVQAVLNDAEKRSFNDESVCLWLKRLKAAAYDIEDMVDQFQTQNQSKDTKVLKYFSSPKSSFSLPIMAHKLKGMRKRLDNIAVERSKYNLREEVIPYGQQVIEGRNTTSAVIRDDVLGRKEEATEIINRLLSASDASTAFSVIPIVGIGGLGKTTLAKLIFNDDRIKEVFEPRIWVHAMEFNVEKLVGGILSSGTREDYNLSSNVEFKVRRAQENLDGKRYLLVLDDVWNEDWEKWEAFKQMLQGGKRESRIIVTTRSERVPSIMGAEMPHMLKPLSDDDCLKLFEQRAFGSAAAKDNHLVSLGEEIVKKCKGVPLTANALGGMLHFTTGEATWKKVRDSELWELNEEEGGSRSENKIISSLKLSYQYMSSPLKLCFVYCSFYPRASELDKDMLIQQWIAQRFIQTEDENEALEIGDGYVNYLLSMSFLEEGQEIRYPTLDIVRVTYKMHDLVYDLARWVAGDEVSVLDARDQSARPNVLECRYASIIKYGRLSGELEKALPRKVRALHFQRCRRLAKGIFSYTKCLRVLDISYGLFEPSTSLIYELKQLRYLKISSNAGNVVDERIGKLHNLIYLDLSFSPELMELPNSIGSLQKLHSLKLHGCFSLQSLPESLGNLMNLNTLNVKNCCRLKSLPESLGNLTELRTLDIQGCALLDELPKSIHNMTHLKIQTDEPLELEPSADMLELYIMQGPSTKYVVRSIIDAKRICLKERGSINSLVYDYTYGLRWGDNAMLEALQPHQNLQELCIKRFSDSMFPSWIRSQIESFLPNLVKIKLYDIYLGCGHLPMLGQLPQLEEILICRMLSVRRISEEFCWARNRVGTPFPSLKRLELEGMIQLEEWVTAAVAGDGERGASLFPCLEELNISNCPRLRVHPCIPPSVRRLKLKVRAPQIRTFLYVVEASLLKHLYISGLKGLVDLPESIRSLTSLETLELAGWKSLATLPEWLGELSSLQSLVINNIPLIDRLPESIQCLAALKSLYIKGCGESLLERTQKDTGEDWDKISHIEDIRITTDS